jgi:hypothetical protein
MRRLGFEDLAELVSYHVRIDEQLTTFREIGTSSSPAIFRHGPSSNRVAGEACNLLIEIKAIAAAR